MTLEKASKLEDGERKNYAEQVAIAFWNSIHDDPSEILLSSDDNDDDRDDDQDREHDSDYNHVFI